MQTMGSEMTPFLAIIPMLFFGALYVLFMIAFVWGFFSMVRSQKRVAMAQEETLTVLKEIAKALRTHDDELPF